MKKLTFLFALSLFVSSASAQMKLIKKLLANEIDTTRRPTFLPIPSFGYAQETGLQFGVGAIFGFYADKKDTTNRSSNIIANLTYSTKKTYNVGVKADIWSKGNKMHYLSEIKFKEMPFNYYGIGNNTIALNSDPLVQSQIRLQFEAERQLLPHAYTGASVSYENYSFKDVTADGVFAKDNSLIGKTGGNVLYLGLSQSYDTRDVNNYPRKGFFGRMTYQYAPDFFGGDNFTGSQIKLNVRNFWPLSKKFVLAAQGLYNTIQGKNTPFYLYQQMGSDEMMRGYYSGRYRDENLLAMQAELRFRYNSRFGATIFAGTGTVWGKSDFKFDTFKPNYGAGFRYFFDPEKGISVRLDYGIGEKLPNEKRQSGFYISLAEAF